MCVVSMVGDHFHDKWTNPPFPYTPPLTWPPDGPTKAEFDELKKEVLEMKKLLERALEYDKRNNQPDCQIEEKMDFLRKVAKLVDVDLDEIFKK